MTNGPSRRIPIHPLPAMARQFSILGMNRDGKTNAAVQTERRAALWKRRARDDLSLIGMSVRGSRQIRMLRLLGHSEPMPAASGWNSVSGRSKIARGPLASRGTCGAYSSKFRSATTSARDNSTTAACSEADEMFMHSGWQSAARSSTVERFHARRHERTYRPGRLQRASQVRACCINSSMSGALEAR